MLKVSNRCEESREGSKRLLVRHLRHDTGIFIEVCDNLRHGSSLVESIFQIDPAAADDFLQDRIQIISNCRAILITRFEVSSESKAIRTELPVLVPERLAKWMSTSGGRTLPAEMTNGPDDQGIAVHVHWIAVECDIARVNHFRCFVVELVALAETGPLA